MKVSGLMVSVFSLSCFTCILQQSTSLYVTAACAAALCLSDCKILDVTVSQRYEVEGSLRPLVTTQASEAIGKSRIPLIKLFSQVMAGHTFIMKGWKG